MILRTTSYVGCSRTASGSRSNSENASRGHSPSSRPEHDSRARQGSAGEALQSHTTSPFRGGLLGLHGASACWTHAGQTVRRQQAHSHSLSPKCTALSLLARTQLGCRESVIGPRYGAKQARGDNLRQTGRVRLRSTNQLRPSTEVLVLLSLELAL
jgi:hypothetical protein